MWVPIVLKVAVASTLGARRRRRISIIGARTSTATVRWTPAMTLAEILPALSMTWRTYRGVDYGGCHPTNNSPNCLRTAQTNGPKSMASLVASSQEPMAAPSSYLLRDTVGGAASSMSVPTATVGRQLLILPTRSSHTASTSVRVGLVQATSATKVEQSDLLLDFR